MSPSGATKNLVTRKKNNPMSPYKLETLIPARKQVRIKSPNFAKLEQEIKLTLRFDLNPVGKKKTALESSKDQGIVSTSYPFHPPWNLQLESKDLLHSIELMFHHMCS
jgi:hypothetical protein